MLKPVFAELIWAVPHRRYRWWLYNRFGIDPPQRVVKAAINKRYRKIFGRLPNLENPTTWTEKLQWLKLNDRNPLMPVLADKYRVRDFVRSRGLGHLLTDLLGVYDKAAAIDFDALPQQYVLKVNHDSGGVVIVSNQDELDREATRTKLAQIMATPYVGGIKRGEWHYLSIPRKIVAESYLGGMLESSAEFRLHCFNGEPKFITVGSSIDGVRLSKLYDPEWQELDVALEFARLERKIPQPELLDEMLRIARILSEGLAYVRVDLYHFDKRIYFGELTFFPGCGFAKLDPPNWDHILGGWLDLAPNLPANKNDN